MNSEFEFIQHIKSLYGLNKVGDDCAVLPKDADTDLLITSDMLVEDVDFRLSWTGPEFLGHKALAVSLSDVAAMGGEPKYSMLSLAVPHTLWESGFVERFYKGWHDLAANWNIELVGGDISRTDGPLVIDSTVLGECPKGKAVLRSGAKVGDLILTTGPLGCAAAGLLELERNDLEPRIDTHVRTQLTPKPRVGEGMTIGRSGVATSMIDTSDGLSSDLRHIIESSGVGAEIELEMLPNCFGVNSCALDDKRLDLVLNGGEDLQLIFTVPDKYFSDEIFGKFHRIGRITANVGTIEVMTPLDRRELPAKGYRHF